MSAPQPPRAPQLPEGAVQVEVTGPAVEPGRAWDLVGDTDWLNRIGGNGVMVEQAMVGAADGLPVLTGAFAGPLGLPLRFEEAWTSWVAGRWFIQQRAVQSPLLRATEYRAELLPAGAQVRPRITLTLAGSTLARPALAATAGRLRDRWQAALEGLAAPPVPRRQLPPSADAALLRWSQQADEEVVERMRALLRAEAPTRLRRLRPYALADRWGLERDRVLDALLHGVLAGALELYWSVRCVRCYGQVAGVGLLSDLADHATCPSCRLDFGNDLGGNVEVLLTPHPAVVERAEERFCTLYPAGAPEHLAVWTIGPGEVREEELPLSAGLLHLGPGGEVPDTRVEVAVDGAARALHWSAGAPPDRARLAPGPGTVRVENDSPGRLRVQLTRDTELEPRMPAAALTTRPLFRRRFGHQVLAPDLRLAARAVTLLFTDLSGSTAMYEALGDAAAFAVVRDHFTVLRGAIEDGGGVVVKTIGDAVMAAFDTPARAVRVALQMQRAFAQWAAALEIEAPPGLKIGVHTGPALAVHSDVAGLDWFGGTVNLAARAESLASRGEVILTEEAATDAEVEALLAAEGLRTERLEREIKGFRGARAFVRLRPA